METPEEKLKRLIWANQANNEEFFHLYGEVERAGACPNPVIHTTSWSALLEALSNEDADTAVLLLQHGGRVPESESITWWAEGMPKVMEALDEFKKRETK